MFKIAWKDKSLTADFTCVAFFLGMYSIKKRKNTYYIYIYKLY